jgi:hypothetical protein
MCFLTSTTTTTILSPLQNYYAYAHLPIENNNNRTQQWISQRDGIRILFIYEPEKPIIDTFTELLTSNDHLKDFMARVVVTNGQRLFKFENITVADGDFSVKYIFPDDGTHQVVTRISKETSIQTFASFNVFVPHQSPPSILNPFPASPATSESTSNWNIIILIILFLTVGVAIAVMFVLPTMRKHIVRRKHDSQ